MGVVTSQNMPMIASCHQELGLEAHNQGLPPSLRKVVDLLTARHHIFRSQEEPGSLLFQPPCVWYQSPAVLVSKHTSQLLTYCHGGSPCTALFQTVLPNLSCGLTSHPTSKPERFSASPIPFLMPLAFPLATIKGLVAPTFQSQPFLSSGPTDSAWSFDTG